MRALWRFVTSVRTCVWTGLVFCLAGAVGSVVMERRPDLFGDMDAQVFTEWLAAKGFAAPGPSLWLYALLATTALFAVTAACCTAERVVRLVRARGGVRRLLPHAMHLGFLGVVLGHLASAGWGDRISGVAVPQGGFAPLGGTGWFLALERLDVTMAEEGYPRDYAAAVALYEGTVPAARGVVRINEPLFHRGYGIYLKSFGAVPGGVPYAVFDANSDPGAGVVLAASLFFTAANLLHLWPTREGDA